MGEDAENPPKKMKTEWSKSYSTVAVTLMEKMGWDSGKGGLGKANQGRLEPVVAIQQDGRRGLGSKLDKSESAITEEYESEHLQIPEPINWLKNMVYEQLNSEDLHNQIIYGDRPTNIENETLFCDPVILKGVLDSKNVLDTLTEEEMRRARARSNPFETIRSLTFLNRAAVKMANINAMCDSMITKPKARDGKPLIKTNELLYFADICAGPGGFSEYLLSVKKWKAKGFGFTLRGTNDFKLDKFLAGAPESFDPYYGVQDDGDIYVEANQDSLRQYIFKHTPEHNPGVHIVMADGGFSVDGNENLQEIMSKQLYLCQFLTALKILRSEGSFVCKTFDLFTPFSIGLIYLMYKSFAQISIIKPNSSRPANSERYLVCKCKNKETDGVIRYLNSINNFLNNRKDGDTDIIGIVSLETIMQDGDFVNYIIDSNNAIGRNQIISLKKFAAFVRDPNLKETRQSDVRKRCIEAWGLRDQIRQQPNDQLPHLFVNTVLGEWAESRLFDDAAKELNSIADFRKYITSKYDWHFVAIGRGDNRNTCSIFMRNTRNTLMRYNEQKKWEIVSIQFDIPPKSIFYAEIVDEFVGEGRVQVRVPALHIIDAILLGSIDIRKEALYERNRLIEMFAESNSKPYRQVAPCIIRAKKLSPITKIDEFFSKMRIFTLKNSDQRLGFDFGDRYFVPGGILMLCNIVHTWMTAYSKNYKAFYYYSTESEKSIFTNDLDPVQRKAIHSSFRNSFQRRLLWKWSKLTQVDESSTGDNDLYRKDIVDYLAMIK